MPKRPQIKPHLTRDQLLIRYRAAVDVTEKKRTGLIFLISEGYSIGEAAKDAGFNYDHARAVLKEYNTYGDLALINKRSPISKVQWWQRRRREHNQTASFMDMI